MSVSALGGYFQNIPSKISVSSGTFASPLQPKDAKDAKDGKDAKAEFLEEASKTPEERIQEAVRKRLGIGEEEFAKMDASARSAVQDAVRQQLRELSEQGSAKSLGNFADVKA